MLFIRRPPHGGFPWGTRQYWMLTADKRIIIRISWIVRGITRSSSTFYNIGTYWVAFERSAFRVDNIFQGCEISLFIVPGYPEYVVMASVLHDDVDDYFRKRIIHYDKPDYKVLSISPIALNGNYYRWHIQAVKKVL